MRRRTNSGGDVKLRELERRVAAGDVEAGYQLHAERYRRGLPFMPDEVRRDPGDEDPAEVRDYYFTATHGARGLLYSAARVTTVHRIESFRAGRRTLWRSSYDWSDDAYWNMPLAPEEGLQALLRRVYEEYVLNHRENPGDEELRRLERRAAAGDADAERALARARQRRDPDGVCFDCERPLQDATPGDVAPYATAMHEGREVKVCRACASERELRDMNREADASRPYSGYVTGDLHRLPNSGRPGWFGRAITTFTGFPLALIVEGGHGPRRSRHRFGNTGQFSWRAIDAQERLWYGRNAGVGMHTNMRLMRRSPYVAEYHQDVAQRLRHAQRLWIAHERGDHLRGCVLCGHEGPPADFHVMPEQGDGQEYWACQLCVSEGRWCSGCGTRTPAFDLTRVMTQHARRPSPMWVCPSCARARQR